MVTITVTHMKEEYSTALLVSRGRRLAKLVIWATAYMWCLVGAYLPWYLGFSVIHVTVLPLWWLAKYLPRPPPTSSLLSLE